MGLFQEIGEEHACWLCEHWGGPDSSGAHAICLQGPSMRVCALPRYGCVFWVRATGSDDDAEPVKRSS